MNKMGAMNAEELAKYKGVFVFAQQVDNVLSGISFELVGEGKRLAEKLGTEVTAVLVGSDVSGLVDELAAYGADKVIVVDDPELKNYRTEPYAHALASVINEFKPEIMLVGATAIGRDLVLQFQQEFRQVLQLTVHYLRSVISLLTQSLEKSRSTISFL